MAWKNRFPWGDGLFQKKIPPKYPKTATVPRAPPSNPPCPIGVALDEVPGEFPETSKPWVTRREINGSNGQGEFSSSKNYHKSQLPQVEPSWAISTNCWWVFPDWSGLQGTGYLHLHGSRWLEEKLQNSPKWWNMVIYYGKKLTKTP